MRKVSVLLLAFVSILVTGCTEKIPQNLPPAAVQGWTALKSIPEGNIRPIGEYSSLFTETRDLLVFADNRDDIKLCYLNKATGWVSVLCKDPLCSHTEEDMCPAVCDRTTASSLCYDSSSGRLYFVRRVFYYYYCFLPQRMWDLSSVPGIKLTPPALEGEILTPGPPGPS